MRLGFPTTRPVGTGSGVLTGEKGDAVGLWPGVPGKGRGKGNQRKTEPHRRLRYKGPAPGPTLWLTDIRRGIKAGHGVAPGKHRVFPGRGSLFSKIGVFYAGGNRNFWGERGFLKGERRRLCEKMWGVLIKSPGFCWKVVCAGWIFLPKEGPINCVVRCCKGFFGPRFFLCSYSL